MEGHQPLSDPQGSASRVRTRLNSRLWRDLLIVCGCLYFVITFLTMLGWSLWDHPTMDGTDLSEKRRLAVVVPTYRGDVHEAVVALSSWPSICSATTLHRMQLVLYYSGTREDGVWSEEIVRTVEQTGGRCFERTRVVFAHLDKEDDVYPKGPSVMFYKLFLDRSVAQHFEYFDAFAVVEWDVIVAHPTSFERLYKAAFFTSEEFWMKGSTLAGGEFHETASVSKMWHILGHLNGNAIYNNADPAFREYVSFTLARWRYSYPFDVALWATIADFPYSWPLWQRYSSKFVATQLISNVGFTDVKKPAVDLAVSRDTLFIHGGSAGGGSTTYNVHGAAHTRDEHGRSIAAPDCTSRCGLQDEHGDSNVSTFCDSSCLPEWSSLGPRFDGHGCGGDDPVRFGKSCRQCFISQEAALVEERRLSLTETTGPTTGVHVVMCSTGNPPPASECSDECLSAADTVCDYRCGSKLYGDLNCNWRRLGQTCRFCFHDSLEAQLADETAKLEGSRVIMCATHEPPVDAWSASALADGTVGDAGGDKSSVESSSEAVNKVTDVDIPPQDATFIGDVNRGEMCAFMAGYFEFLPETRVSVSSVLHFMPGMKIAIATHPVDFHVYNRTLGQFPVVAVVNSTHVEHASVHADKACGAGTRLIFYMDVGEVLSRSFTAKDTHTPRGDLMVSYTDTANSHDECIRRAMGASILLRFSPPCFTYGSDLILPAELNERLRGVLRSGRVLQPARARPGGQRVAREDDIDDDLMRSLASISEIHRGYATIFIPEVLAALAFSQSPGSMAFTNSRRWNVDNMFVHKSIWDIPLIKPRFGCSYNMALSHLGYDLSDRISKEFESFKLGLKCEMGFREIHPSQLSIKTHQEFGVVGALKGMPDLTDFRVSVMYCTMSGNAELFELSIQSVIRHFRSALEVVAVVIEEDEELFQGIMDRHRASAPFPLRLATEPDLVGGHVQPKYSKLKADLYTQGDHILHLDSDVIVLEDIKYSHIFHFGKPVLPFRRHRRDTPEGLRRSVCWQRGASFAVGEDLVHEYDLFNTNVYPRAMYPSARQFIEEYHQKSFKDFMLTRRGLCPDTAELETLTEKAKIEMFSDSNFIGAYLWYHMHDTVYWLPADPWDIQPDQWRPDLSTYAWVCKAGGRHTPDDKAGLKQYVEDFHAVQSQTQCQMVVEHWTVQKRKDPTTRQKIDMSSKEWLETVESVR